MTNQNALIYCRTFFGFHSLCNVNSIFNREMLERINLDIEYKKQLRIKKVSELLFHTVSLLTTACLFSFVSNKKNNLFKFLNKN